MLAAEVQVEEPGEGSEGEPKPEQGGMADEVRFALTAEAGLNDSLAFPFTYLAILFVLVGADPSNWAGQWLVTFVGYKLVVGWSRAPHSGGCWPGSCSSRRPGPSSRGR